MLFPCQHHSWEVWLGQGKALLMILNKLPWVSVMLWQQELAPGICCFSAWGTRATRAGRLLCAWPVPCWALCWLGQGMRVLRPWLSAGEAALDDPSGWESVSQETSSLRQPRIVATPSLPHLRMWPSCPSQFAALLDYCLTLLELRVSLSQDSARAAKRQPVDVDTHTHQENVTHLSL